MRALEDEIPQLPGIIPLPTFPHPTGMVCFSNLLQDVLTLLDRATDPVDRLFRGAICGCSLTLAIGGNSSSMWC